jgi:hypothetical protein
MANKLLASLSNNQLFSTYRGGVELEKPLANMDAPLAEIDAYTGMDIPAKLVDKDKRDAFVARQQEFLSNSQNGNIYGQASSIKRFANETALDMKNPLSETGRTVLNYDATVKLDEEETKRTQTGKIDSSDQFIGKELREAQYELEGGAGTVDEYGIFIPNEYKPTNIAPDKIDTEKIKKSYGEGFKDQVLEDGKGGYRIRASSNPTKDGYIRDYFEKWSGVTGDRVGSYVAASLMYDDKWRPRVEWEGKKSFVGEKAKELGGIKEASKYAIQNPEEMAEYVNTYMENEANEQAGLEVKKHTKLDIDKKTGLKGDPNYGIKLKHKLKNAPGITMSVEGNLSKHIPVDLTKVKESIATNKPRIEELENLEEMSDAEYNELRSLKQSQRILEGTLKDYRKNYVDAPINKESVTTTLNAILGVHDINGKKVSRTEEAIAKNEAKGWFPSTFEALSAPSFGNIKTEKDVQDLIAGRLILPEEVLNKTFKVTEARGTLTPEIEYTVREAVEKIKLSYDDRATEYAQENPFSYKTEYLSAPDGIGKEASETIIGGIAGGSYTVDGSLDANTFLEENFYSGKGLSSNDYNITTRISKERLHGEQSYQLILEPKTKAAKEAIEHGTTSVIIYPTDNSTIHGQVGNALQHQVGGNFEDANGDIDPVKALQAGIDPTQVTSGWRTIEDKDLYKAGLFMEADDKIGSHFIPVLDKINSQGVGSLTSKDTPSAFINLADDYDEDSKPTQVKITRVVKQRKGRTIVKHKYNYVNSRGEEMYNTEDLVKKYGADYSDGIMSVKDLEMIMYLEKDL